MLGKINHVQQKGIVVVHKEIQRKFIAVPEKPE